MLNQKKLLWAAQLVTEVKFRKKDKISSPTSNNDHDLPPFN